jgi:hypothetical protein
MKALFRLLLGSFVALLVAAGASIALTLQLAPVVAPAAEVSVADVDRARRLVGENDPRGTPPGALRRVDLSQADVDLLLGLLARRVGQSAARVEFGASLATLRASVRLEQLPLGPWLNVVARVRVISGLPAVESVRIGRLPVPGWLTDLAIRQAMKRMDRGIDTTFLANMIQAMRITPGRIEVAYRWRGDSTTAHLKSLLVPPGDVERLAAYQAAIGSAAKRAPPGQPVSVAALIPPVFGLARVRSAEADPARENRAAIAALALYANSRELRSIAPGARPLSPDEIRSVTLAGRTDFARHFLISAALAAESGGALADAIGLYKEVDDTRGGSGFSFTDLAADRTGTRFGQLAMLAPGRLQTVLAAGIGEADFMPEIGDLPEFMPEEEFRRRFGGVDAPAYTMMVAEIDSRIAARPLFR